MRGVSCCRIVDAPRRVRAVLAGEMDLPPEEVAVEEAEAPTPKKPEARPPKKAAPAPAPAPAPGPPEIVETDMAYIERPSPFYTRAPDSEA